MLQDGMVSWLYVSLSHTWSLLKLCHELKIGNTNLCWTECNFMNVFLLDLLWQNAPLVRGVKIVQWCVNVLMVLHVTLWVVSVSVHLDGLAADVAKVGLFCETLNTQPSLLLWETWKKNCLLIGRLRIDVKHKNFFFTMVGQSLWQLILFSLELN